MIQPDLFAQAAQAAPFARGSETSRRAAEQIGRHVNALQARVLGAIRASGARGMTRDDIAIACGLKNQTLCPRVLELLAAGLIVESDRRRPTRSGRLAVVLVGA